MELSLKDSQSNVNTGNNLIAYTAPQEFLDATASFWLNEYIGFGVDALNLTNTNVYTYHDNPDRPNGDGKSRRDNSLVNGTTISFGVRGKSSGGCVAVCNMGGVATPRPVP